MGNPHSCVYIPQNRKSIQLKRRIKQEYRDPEKNTVIKKNETVEIVNEKSEDYYLERGKNYAVKDYSLVKNSEGTTVLVPNELLAYDKYIENEEWFFGSVSRFEVEKTYLTREVDDGTYLVRLPSSDYKCKYVLSVKKNNGCKYVYHYPIKYKYKKFYIQHMCFPTVVKILDYFTQNRGLETKLIKPCTKEKTLQQPVYNLSPIYSLVWEIDRKEIEIKKPLGQGNYGEVYLGRWRDRTDVAVKQLVTKKQFDKDAFAKEVAAMKKLRHENIILLYGVCTKEQPYLLINEFAEYGDLKKYLENSAPIREDLISMSYQIANGMKYLEKQNIIHRDLAARNILLDESFKIKIGNNKNNEGIQLSNTENDYECIRLLKQRTNLDDYEDCIENEPWYFGSITRIEAEKVYLTSAVEDGTFLIRKSTSDDSSFALSVKYFLNKFVHAVVHYKIYFDDNRFFISEELRLPNLFELVKVYTRFKLLVTKLTKLCKKIIMKRQYQLSPKFSSDWEIPREDLDIDDEILGNGNFGTVHRGYFQKNIQVTVKKIATAENFDKKLFFKEVAIMKKIRHNNIICLYGMSTTTEPYLIINEIASNGHLKSCIKINDCILYDYVNFASEITDGMEYLAKRNIVHRDLACRNILLDYYLSVKISDFGLSRQLIDGEYIAMNNSACPVRWCSIEALSNGSFTTKSDVWSFGILLYEMFTKCERPYKDINSHDLLPYLLSGKRLTMPHEMPEEIYRICLDCWNANPNKRPSFKNLKHTINYLKLNNFKSTITVYS